MSLRRCCITPYGGPHLDSCPAMPTPPPRPEPDWRSLCAQLAEALRGVESRAPTPEDLDALDDDAQSGRRTAMSLTIADVRSLRTALTAYARAVGNRPNSSESSPPGVGESGGE